jgi:hypothetical protein
LGENPLNRIEKSFKAELRHRVCVDECYGDPQRREIMMSNSVKQALASVTQALVAVTDHLSGADIVRRDQQTLALSQQRVSERIQALRDGFTTIRQRRDELSERIAETRRRIA